MRFENEEHFCQNCREDTPHSGNYSDHERDSTADWFVCQICFWEYSGWDGKYHEPDTDIKYE